MAGAEAHKAAHKAKLVADLSAWAGNVSTSVFIVFINKLLMKNYSYHFATTLVSSSNKEPPPLLLVSWILPRSLAGMPRSLGSDRTRPPAPLPAAPPAGGVPKASPAPRLNWVEPRWPALPPPNPFPPCCRPRCTFWDAQSASGPARAWG